MAEGEEIVRRVDELILDALRLRLRTHARKPERVEDIWVFILRAIAVDAISRRNDRRAARKSSAVVQCYVFHHLPPERDYVSSAPVSMAQPQAET